MAKPINYRRTSEGSTLLAGLRGYTAPRTEVVGAVAGDEIVSCPELYGGFVVRRHTGAEPPYAVGEGYRRPYPATTRRPDGVEADELGAGFTRLDRALAAAANLYHGARYPWSSTERREQSRAQRGDHGARWEPNELGLSEAGVTNLVKGAAKLLGASVTGIARADPRWFYAAEPNRSRSGSPSTMAEIRFSEGVGAPAILDDGTKLIPSAMRYAVVMAFEMSAGLMDLEVSATASAGTLDGYSRMWFTATRLAEFFREMGYHAIPMGNDTALSEPMAIDAGLGEMGRSGLLITPRYGPRVRLAKILTDFPLLPDAPISFGVTEFCESCLRCARECPGGAISLGARSMEATEGGIPGVLRWAADGTKCRTVWARATVSCHNCIRVCPFSKPGAGLYRVARQFLAGA